MTYGWGTVRVKVHVATLSRASTVPSLSPSDTWSSVVFVRIVFNSSHFLFLVDSPDPTSTGNPYTVDSGLAASQVRESWRSVCEVRLCLRDSVHGHGERSIETQIHQLVRIGTVGLILRRGGWRGPPVWEGYRCSSETEVTGEGWTLCFVSTLTSMSLVCGGRGFLLTRRKTLVPVPYP